MNTREMLSEICKRAKHFNDLSMLQEMSVHHAIQRFNFLMKQLDSYWCCIIPTEILYFMLSEPISIGTSRKNVSSNQR